MITYAQTDPGEIAVRCGFGEAIPDCKSEHLFQLAENIVGVFIWLAIIGIGLVIVWQGIKMILFVFNPDFFGKGGDIIKSAKKAITSSIFGLFLVLGAWLIIKYLFQVLGYSGNIFG